jgi:hypothetical protein
VVALPLALARSQLGLDLLAGRFAQVSWCTVFSAPRRFLVVTTLNALWLRERSRRGERERHV